MYGIILKKTNGIGTIPWYVALEYQRYLAMEIARWD